MSTEQTTPQVLNIKCPNCGSPGVKYNAAKLALHCDYCGFTKELPRETDEVKEHPLHLDSDLMKVPQGLEIDHRVFHCQSCGSETSIPGDMVRVVCPFCGSENINETATETRVIRPMGVLPFKVAKEDGHKQYKTWLTKGWFTPNNLRQFARLENMHGVYLPFWTFDAYTRSRWQAESGYYYFETQQYRDQEGRVQTRQVQRIRWRPSAGRLEHFFDDVLVVASHGVSQGLINRILPYNLSETNNYDSQFLLGWEAELYQKNVKEGFRDADRMMDESLYQMCARQVPGDTHRFLRVDTHKEGLTFKHLLLPVWIAAYKYKNKTYQFIINGQTGTVAGKKPKSPGKIILAIVGALILGAALAYFAGAFEGAPR